MTWSNYYTLPDKKHWQGRADSPSSACFFQIIQMLDLTKPLPALTHPVSFALLGFACDEGIRRNLGRTGAEEGPDQAKICLARLPVQNTQFGCYDAGNIICKDGDLESSQAALSETVALLIAHGMTPIVIGGGHEVAYGHYLGIAKQYPDEHLGIINFDAHFDMRPLPPNHQGSSGTPFLQIAKAHAENKRRFDYNCIGIQHAGNIRQLFETAKHYHANIILSDDLHQGYMDKCINFVDRVIDQNQLIYLSLCLDVFATPYAPGVSAPQPMGLTPWQVVPLVRQLAGSGKVVSYDIAELSPPYDQDQRTAKLAANFIYEIIHHHHVLKVGNHNGH